jgi:hypothetical protein
VKFVERTNQSNWIRIETSPGCYSRIGKTRRRGAQLVSLQKDGCIFKGMVAHELWHVLGLDHEHCRSDRDNWIEVFEKNIMRGKAAPMADRLAYKKQHKNLKYSLFIYFAKNIDTTLKSTIFLKILARPMITIQ